MFTLTTPSGQTTGDICDVLAAAEAGQLVNLPAVRHHARHGVVSNLGAFVAVMHHYPSARMGDKAAGTEASRLKQHPLVVRRIAELNALLVEVDLHDRAETQAFVLAGLKRLAVNGDNSSAQIAAYRLIGNLSHARMFDAPVVGQAPDTRSADSIRKALQQRVSRLLPPPAGANGSLSSGDDDDSAVDEMDGADEASG